MEAAADWDRLRTPETHLGYGRGGRLVSPGAAAFDQRGAYELPEHLRFNHWALAGEWTIGPEKVSLDGAGGSIAQRPRRIPPSVQVRAMSTSDASTELAISRGGRHASRVSGL